jgi:acetate kinase
LFEAGDSLRRILAGAVEGIGLPEATLRVKGSNQADNFSRTVPAKDHTVAVGALMDWIEERSGRDALTAVGHRIVHGGPKYSEPQRITPEMIEELHRLSSFDPEHLPEEILLTEAFHRRFPSLPQVACFDTAFYHNLPRVARLLPIPRRYEAQGVRRYGFHGLSYAFLMGELARVAGTQVAEGRVILAHLGNGASLAAVRDGAPVDTSMSFTPTAGLVMSTRSGDLDPGLVWYLARTEDLNAKRFNEMVNFQSGLLGVSETTSDMRDLLDRETRDVRAADAVALFCCQVKKWIGAFAAALGGLDTLVFAGGIGENPPAVRARICDGLGFLGIGIEEKRNAANEGVISAAAGRVAVRVIRTDEELMIARSVTASSASHHSEMLNHENKAMRGDQSDEEGLQSWRSCGVELGSRPRPGNDQEKDHLRHLVQGLHGPRLEGRAAVSDQKRRDRPPGHAQGIGAQETQKQAMRKTRTPKDEPSPVVMTIGHSTHTLEEFVGLLQAHGATRVVDVRTLPRSRHNPHFNESSLSQSLKEAGVGYVHLPALGGLRHTKRDSPNGGWRNASFRGYADYMQTPEFAQGLEELIRLANEERIILMCAEAVPWRCHRSLIADALLIRGIHTEHIMSASHRQVHALTPFARVRGTAITYPAEVSARERSRRANAAGRSASLSRLKVEP